MDSSSSYVTSDWIRNNAELLAHVINATFYIAQRQNIQVPQVTPEGYCIMGRPATNNYDESPVINGPIFGNPDNSVDEVDVHSPVSSLVGNYDSRDQLNDLDLLEAAILLEQYMNHYETLVENMDNTSRTPMQEENHSKDTTSISVKKFEVDLERPQGEGCDVPPDAAHWYVLPDASSSEQTFPTEGNASSQRPYSTSAPYHYEEIEEVRALASSLQSPPCQVTESHPPANTASTSCLWSCWRRAINED